MSQGFILSGGKIITPNEIKDLGTRLLRYVFGCVLGASVYHYHFISVNLALLQP